MAAGLQPRLSRAPARLSQTAEPKPYVSTKVPLPSQRLRSATLVPHQARAQTPAPAAKRQTPAPHEFPEYDAPLNAGQHVSPEVRPEDLHKLLEVAPYVRLTFPTNQRLERFRHNLYSVNVQGKFRFATRREGWTGLIVLRLK